MSEAAATPPEASRFALVVGINNSSVSNYLPSLVSAERDAYEISQTLQHECKFKFLNPVLLGAKAETRDVWRAVIELVKKRTDQDFLLFYFIGHAQPIKTKEGYHDIYFVTYDFDPNDVKEDTHMHLSMRWLQDKLYQTEDAGSVLIVLDCCYAGNIIEARPDPSHIHIDVNIRQIVKECLDGPSVTEQKDRLRVILTATQYNTPAQERVMTRLLLPALKGNISDALDPKGDVNIHTLYMYLQDQMPEEQLPNLEGKFARKCILASYPEKSKSHLQKIQEAEEDERWGEIFKFVNKMSRFFDDSNYLKHTEISSSQSFDHSLCRTASLVDIDLEKVNEFFQRDRLLKQKKVLLGVSDREQLEQFGLLKEGFPTYGALLCFGKAPQHWISSAITRCINWNGDDHFDRLQDSELFQGNILSQFKSSCDFLRRCLRLSRVIGSERTTEQWEIPFRVLEEALVNALVHREYENQKGFVQVQVFSDRIEISSPGAPPAPMTIDRLGKEAISYPRNFQIALIFYLYSYLEQAGSGIPRMRRLMEEAELPPPQFELSEVKIFKVILYRPKYVPEVVIKSKEFGLLLTQGVESIAKSRKKPVTYAENELRSAAGLKSTSLIQKWRQGIVPSQQDQIVALARTCVRLGKMHQEWLRIFLKEARYPTPESLIDELFPTFLGDLKRFRTRNLYLLISIFILAIIVIIPVAAFLTYLNTPVLSPTSSTSTGIGVTMVPDGEAIGISNGTFAFDTNRVDGDLKRHAADELKAGKITSAESLWRQAFAMDTNDAETLIYQEDQRILDSQRPYFTLVIGAILTGDFASTGRDALQGAYVAQKEYNDHCSELRDCVEVRLLVANSGSGDSSRAGIAQASMIMEQIVQAAHNDPTIVGVMGWPISSDSLYVATILGSAHIPMVSPTASLEAPTQASPYFFRVAPSNKSQGMAGAKYAEQVLHARRVALFVDPIDPYSESLASAFKNQFTADNNAIVATENYTVGRSGTTSSLLQQALGFNPDLIYFAGHANDIGALLANLPTSGKFASLQVLGGDGLYELGGYSAQAATNLSRLHFTAFAYPDEWNFLAPSVQRPLFFSAYPQTFDPQGKHANGDYSYRRADNDIILSTDALETLLAASTLAFGGRSSFTSDDLQQALSQINGSQAVQGVSGQISFGPDGNPINKVIVVLHWNSLVQIQFEQAYGCFLKPTSISPNPACS